MDVYAKEARQLALWFTAISTLAVFALLPFSKITFTGTDLGRIAFVTGIAGVCAGYCWKRGMDRLAPGLEAVMLGLFMTVPILVSTYLAMSLDHPLADESLAYADGIMGFDWTVFIGFVDGHPDLATALQYAYSSISFQLLTLPLLLGIAGYQERSYRMIFAYGVICYTSSIISIWFPALGTYAAHGISQPQLNSINVHYGFAFLHDFLAVRSAPTFTLSLANASGIVTFPSVHAAAALLCGWAAWPVKSFRYPFAALNVLMAVSAVSNGGHYVTDIVAGFLVATISIAVVTQVLRWQVHAKYRLPGIIGQVSGAQAT